MKKHIFLIGLILCLVMAFSACGQSNIQDLAVPESFKNDSEGNTMNNPFHFVNETVGSGFADDLLAGVYKHANEMESYYTEQIFADEDAIKKETISSEGVNNIKLEAVYGAVYIEPSLDADIHLEYPKEAGFIISHKVVDGDLKVSASVSTPGNYDILKVYIPSESIKALTILEGTSSIHVIGQEGMLESCNIEVALGSVYLENIYADIKVKTETGTIRMKNDTIKSNIHLITQMGVIDFSVSELPDDVSLYTSGNSIRNTLLEGRDSISPNEQYAVTLENSVGGINIQKEN